MRPSVGRVVMYTSLGDRDGKFPPEVQAALITKVKSVVTTDDVKLVPPPEEAAYLVSLHVFFELGEFNMLNVPFTTAPAGTEKARGCWSWPERLV